MRKIALFILTGGLAAFPTAPSPAGICINEVMPASSFVTAIDEDGDFQGWVELYNRGSQAIDLTGYYLSNDPGHVRKWRFPQGSMPARGFLLVWVSGKNRLGRNGELHTNFRLGPLDGVLLTAPDGITRVDLLEPPSSIPSDESYGRYPDGADKYLFYTNLTSTPGKPNEEPRSWVKVTHNAAFAPRDYGGDVVFDGKMWLLGGWPGGKKDIWYSTDGATWVLATANPPWPGRHVFGCLVYRGKMWVIGGTSGKADVWNSADGVQWEEVTPKAPWPANTPGRAVVYRDKMWYLAEGKSLWHSKDGANWILATDRPGWPERGSPSFVVFRDRMWVLAGGTWRTGRDVVHNDVWFSTDGANWSCATSNAEWAPRRWPAVQVYQDKLWLMGGHYGLEGRPQNLNDVWFSDDGIHWRELVSKTAFTPRHAAQSWVYDGSLWFGAGYYHSFALYNDIWRMTLSVSDPALTAPAF